MELPSFSIDLAALSDQALPAPDVTHDVLILGGGPAALSAAIYAARKLLRAAVVARELGGQITGTSEVENYLGYQSITGRELADRFMEHARQFALPMALGEEVLAVARDGDDFAVTLASGTVLRAHSVILATGKRHRHLQVPGEQELAGRGVAYCAICDAPFFRDRRVVVAGGGNSAFTAALDLAKLATQVTVVNAVAGWQADPVLVQAVSARPTVRLLDRHLVTRIEGAGRVEAVQVKDRSTEHETRIPADGIFVEIGLLPNSDPVKDLATLNAAGEVVVDCHCRTSVPGLFGAGDVTTVPYQQIVISAGEGAKAALAAYDHLTRRGLI